MKPALAIPAPCSQDWEEMTHVEGGRHCKHCQKTVIDFTAFPDEQILRYLKEHTGERVCGRIRSRENKTELNEVIIYPRASPLRHGFYPLLKLSLAALLLSSCGNPEEQTKNPSVQESTVTHLTDTPEVSLPGSIATREEDTSAAGKTETPSPATTAPAIPSIVGELIFIVEDTIPIKAEPQTGIVVNLPDSTIHSFPETPAQFPGGEDSLRAYLFRETHYPEPYKNINIQGRVIVRFVITREGKVTSPEIIRGIPGSVLLEQEALRVITAMPDWLPAKNGNTPVNSYLHLPIRFSLR